LVEKAVQTTDKKERLRLYAEINKIQLSEVPMIRTALQPTTYAWKSYVKAYEVTPIKLVGYPGKAGIQNVWLDK
jgi:ABC-type transport system substrate-binding protein